MQWTKERPSKPGYYWAYSTNIQKVRHIDIDEDYLKYNECDIHGSDESISLNRFTHFIGPLEIPKDPIDDYAKYIINRFKEAGLTPQYVRVKIEKNLFEGINAIPRKNTEVFDISIINNKQIWNWNTTSCEEHLDEIIDSNIKLSIDHLKRCEQEKNKC